MVEKRILHQADVEAVIAAELAESGGGAPLGVGDYWYGAASSAALLAGLGTEVTNLDEVWGLAGNSIAVVNGVLTITKNGIYAVTATASPVHTTSQPVIFMLAFNGDFGDWVTPASRRDYTNYVGEFGWNLDTISTVTKMMIGTTINIRLSKINNTDPVVVTNDVEFSIIKIA